MGTRTGARTLAIVAALGLSFLAPTTASAASTSEDPTAKGQHYAWTPNYAEAVGHAMFEDYGERLFVCDDWPDGRGVKATLKWGDQEYTVSSPTFEPAPGACAEAHNVPNIPEGHVVYFKAESGDTSSGWVKATA